VARLLDEAWRYERLTSAAIDPIHARHTTIDTGRVTERGSGRNSFIGGYDECTTRIDGKSCYHLRGPSQIFIDSFRRMAMIRRVTITVVLIASTVRLPAQQPPPRVDPSLFAEMRWRNIGPMRAGRTKAAAGHPSQPYTFYIGVCNGGVWKTTDAGRTWKPLFDEQPTGSIGWVSVAPSDP